MATRASDMSYYVMQVGRQDKLGKRAPGSGHFYFQPRDFVFNELGDSMFGHIDLVERLPKGGGHLRGGPAFIHVAIKYLIFLRIEPALHNVNSALKHRIL